MENPIFINTLKRSEQERNKMNIEEKNSIFEFLYGALPSVDNKYDLKTHFNRIMNVVDTSEDTEDEYPEYNSLRFQCSESECWGAFQEFSERFFDSDGNKKKIFLKGTK